jgi:hypothetical protein
MATLREPGRSGSGLSSGPCLHASWSFQTFADTVKARRFGDAHLRFENTCFGDDS